MYDPAAMPWCCSSSCILQMQRSSIQWICSWDSLYLMRTSLPSGSLWQTIISIILKLLDRRKWDGTVFAQHQLIYLLNAIGLSPGGSSTVHIYTQTIHRTTQNKQYIEQHNNLGNCGPYPVLASYTLAFALQMRKKHGKTSVRIAASKNT